MAPVADRTEGANIGSLTDGSVGRARRRHKKTEGEEGEEGKRRGGEGRGAGPVSARWRARPRNFSVVFRGPWSSGPEMKAEPPLNAAAGLRSKIPLLPEHPKAKNVRLYMYAPRRAATSRHFSPSRSARSSTRHSRHTRFSPFFFFLSFFIFDHLLLPPLPPSRVLSLELSSSLSRALGQIFWNSSRAPVPLRLLVALSLHLSFPPCFLLRCLPLGRFRGKAGPRRSTPPSPPTRRSIGIRGPAARGPRSRSLARSPGRSGALSARLEPVAYAFVRLCRPPLPPSPSLRTSSRHRFDASTDRCANGSR